MPSCRICDEVLLACCRGESIQEEVELLRVLCCLGLQPSKTQVRDALAARGLSLPCCLATARSIADDFHGDGGSLCRPWVPHARRGVRLCQLQMLDRVFVQSGWLGESCDTVNCAAASQQQCTNGSKKRPLKEDLYALDRLVLRPSTCGAHVDDELWSMLVQVGAKERCQAQPCSFSELLNPAGCKVNLFVSHYWGHPFSGTVRMLTNAAEASTISGLQDPGDTTYWICAFSLNQHQLTEELGDSPEEAPFNIALQKATHGVVMVLDPELSPFRRIWCLYEVSRANDLNRPFMMLADNSSEPRVCLAHKLKMSACSLSKKLHEVQALNAKASREEDRLAILYRIMNSVQRSRYASYETFKLRMQNPSSVLASVGHSSFSEFDIVVRERLSTPLLKCNLENGLIDDAMQYAPHAKLELDSLQRIVELKGDINARLISFVYGEWATETLLHKTAVSGDETVAYLIAQRADVNAKLESDLPEPMIIKSMAAWVHGSTALHTACWHGNLAAVKHLLKGGADVNMPTKGLANAFFFTARPHEHHMEIIETLLSYSGDMKARDAREMTLLHVTSSNMNEQLTKFLLDRGFSVHDVDEDGATPLHVSSNWGTTVNVPLLAAARADLNAKRHVDGATPIHRAARSGHYAIVKQLLELRADTGIRDHSGHTALEVAEQHGRLDMFDCLK